MSTPLELVRTWTAASSDKALSGVRTLSLAPDVRILQPSPARRRAADALGTWSIRLATTRNIGKKALGLQSLVRRLRSLPPERDVEQIGLQQGRTTGLIFYDPVDRVTLGAILTVRTAEDDERSRRNYAFAMGLPEGEGEQNGLGEKREPEMRSIGRD